MSEHTHHHGHHPHGEHGDHDRSGLAEQLTLDAAVLGGYLDQATAWAAGLAPTNPGVVVDAGSGSGVGTLALAGRFPDARIVAVDVSAEMLNHTRHAAREQGLDDRLDTVEADLNGAWPGIAAADLIWAASSLHELADPERSMREMYAALNPGGLLVVLEMDSLPRFLPDEASGDRAAELGLEGRLHADLARMGWNSYPDWQDGLEKAGFDVIERRSYPTSSRSTSELTARYARAFLGRIQTALGDVASAADLAALGRLLADDGDESLEMRTDLLARGSRTAWAALKR
ncbi:hypothetical protein AL755_10385 [Arthrobacter sp. ERGS1:01]|uniref:class I SAM-dependent methyltransferase n=1 Tax=Arthrobacter sp. ERGS1:01 TaxID=1704044 RepID=UPI0006B6490D|nr:class I SAM-dependent methyltransferase [Arthrobacter sp. ERGS1:01]ALE05783.1 hypothetical protein AL755_10385 [Arthrobacter sp. ERGS1:01]